MTPAAPRCSPAPALPATDDRTIADCHDADITPDTIIPAWYGERLDLDYAIYTSFANADYHARQRDEQHSEDQDTTATPPGPETEPETATESFTPLTTEVNVLSGISQLFEEQGLT